MVEITLSIVLQIVQTIALIIGIVYYITIMRNTQRTRELSLRAQELTLKAQEQAKETRQAQLLMQIYEAYRDAEFRLLAEEIINQEWTDYVDFWEKYGAIKNPVAWSRWGSVAAFFNGVGVLLKKELIDIDLVEELISNQAFVLWMRMEPILAGWRENVAGVRFGEQASSKKYEPYSGFVYLIKELKKREQEYLKLKT
ncbi:MAG TPA: hypothetical protein VM050_09070 [Patescibacteria group bacterium]|nr:hypothetical protein [Patescibacteria group bacterium]